MARGRGSSNMIAALAALLLAGTAGHANTSFDIPWTPLQPPVGAAPRQPISSSWVTVDPHQPRRLLLGGDVRRPFRVMGMNMVAHSQFPPNASYADKTVRRLSSLGFTALRLHGGDGAVSKGGMVQRNTQTGRGELNETLARRFDTLLAACRRHGLYVEISLSAINPFYATSALETAGRGQVPSYHKGVSLFHQGLMRETEDYIAELLQRVNTVTNVRLADDPTVALLELSNENGLCAGTKLSSTVDAS